MTLMVPAAATCLTVRTGIDATDGRKTIRKWQMVKSRVRKAIACDNGEQIVLVEKGATGVIEEIYSLQEPDPAAASIFRVMFRKSEGSLFLRFDEVDPVEHITRSLS